MLYLNYNQSIFLHINFVATNCTLIEWMSNDFHTSYRYNARQVFYDSYNRNLNFRVHCGRKIMLIIFHTIFELEKAK